MLSDKLVIFNEYNNNLKPLNLSYKQLREHLKESVFSTDLSKINHLNLQKMPDHESYKSIVINEKLPEEYRKKLNQQITTMCNDFKKITNWWLNIPVDDFKELKSMNKTLYETADKTDESMSNDLNITIQKLKIIKRTFNHIASFFIEASEN